MNLTVDGLIYQRQVKGGVSRIFNEILPLMCSKCRALSVRLVALGKLAQDFPRHEQIRPIKKFSLDGILWPQRVWWPVDGYLRELALLQLSGQAQNAIWHSTYYTIPPGWKGPKIVSVYDLIHEKFSHLFLGPRWDQVRREMARAIHRADILLCISESTAVDLIEVHGVSPEKVRVAPLAHSSVFEEGTAGFSGKPDKPYLLTVSSRFGHPTFAYKNVKTFLDAYAGWEFRKDFEIICVADRWSDLERHVLSDMGLSDDVKLRANPSDQELAGLYHFASASVYPSKYEGFGIPVLESLAAQCPVVTTRVPSMLEVGLNAPFYFDPTDVEELRQSLTRAVLDGRDPDRIALGREVSRRFSWDRTARATLEAYESVL